MPVWLSALCLLTLSSLSELAWANQADIQRGSAEWSFDLRWTDASGASQQAQFSLPAEAIQADHDEPMSFQKPKAAKYIASEVRSWANQRKGPKIEVKVVDGEVQIRVPSAKSKEAAQRALDEAMEQYDLALDRWLAEQGFTKIDEVILPDHARHVVDYSDDLRPVVEALGGPGESPRAFADRALSFVQSIPYEMRVKVSDRYRRPLSILGRNKGDCDSKTVLFLALMRQAWPDTGSAIVYIQGHAFGALALEPESGDDTVKVEGEIWVGVEPVGPSLAVAGELGKTSRRKARWGRYELAVVED